MMKILVSIGGLLIVAMHVLGHGRIMDPPGRNTMWRFGFPYAPNYNDNELFCGGAAVQQLHNGKCGICGDNWADKTPRMHEQGGTFGSGIIGKQYVKDQKIKVNVELTANHRGFFEFKLCPTNGDATLETQECLDKYPLSLASDPKETKFFLTHDEKNFNVSYELLLPEGLTCSKCVIQWTYIAGNTWGVCANGTGLNGCGPQENFRNCADVEIVASASELKDNVGVPANRIFFRDNNGLAKPLVVKSQVCVPRENFDTLGEWCQTRCLSYPPACNQNLCKCLGHCKAIGDLAGINGTDFWCHRQCLTYPSKCPKDKCVCAEEMQAFY